MFNSSKKMSRLDEEEENEYFLGFWGVAIHFIVLYGVLDANFHSPVLRDLSPVPPLENAPAKRLFLFVADGLRYRTFSSATPEYFKDIMMNKGVWGISHTRVPTESRPGNVAIAAGLYEDPSALFKGWKENPVDFDSVFNQSRITYAWGSPDIIPMFVKGSRGNVHGASYPHDWQDFDKSSNSPERLDEWVFSKFDEWLKTEAKNIQEESGVIIFFHLLGCDTAGHASKPTSREYVSEMEYVAEKIRQVVEKENEFFRDNKSTYIFTSDHGMTEWGSHGGGSQDETETPFVAWGAGIDHSRLPRNIKQADIAPLISSLIGISIPTNNEGILPRFYLKSANDEYGLKATLNNIKQLIIQVKANRVLTSGDNYDKSHWREQQLQNTVDAIEGLIKENNIEEALRIVDSAIEESKSALHHYRQLQRNQLIIYLTLLWIGWIVLLILKLIGTKRERLDERNTSKTSIIANAVFLISVILLIIEHSFSGRRDWRVLGYGIISFFSIFLSCRRALTHTIKFEAIGNFQSKISIICTIVLIAIMSAGIIQKYFFSLAMVMTAFMQRVLMKNRDRLLVPTALILAIYPFFSAQKQQNEETMFGSMTLSLLITMQFILPCLDRRFRVMEIAKQILTASIMMGIIDGRNGFSWIILITAPLCILSYPTEDQKIKLTGVIYGLICPLILLSSSHEPEVFIVLGLHLISLLKTMKEENCISTRENRKLTLQDVVTAVYLMLYILLSFFGTGNIASISSFDPMWTRHFITVFSPFTMTILILLKFAFPLILVGCASRILASSKTFLAVLLLGDCMSLPLMYSVTSEGSWLDIGTAISRYTISISLPCLFLVLYYISGPLMLFSITKANYNAKKQHII